MSKKLGAGKTAAAYHIVSAMIVDDMPLLSMFYGIVIYVYALDNRRHHRPCFDAEFVEFSWSSRLMMAMCLTAICRRQK